MISNSQLAMRAAIVVSRRAVRLTYGALRASFWLSLMGVGAVSAAERAAEPPMAPATIETACLKPSTVNIYWSEPAAGVPTAYRVFRNGLPIADLPQAARRFEDSGLVPGSCCRYSTAAVYPDGTAIASHVVAERIPLPLIGRRSCDVIVVSASSAGVAAAVTAARKGLHVALLEPTDRLGGIMSNGLCATDIRRAVHSTGFFEEFRQKVQTYYGGGDGLAYEPHVVNNVLKAMVAAEDRVDVFYHVRPTGVIMDGATVTGLRVESTDGRHHGVFEAPLTIDSDPTGDVTAWAGCRCRVGREPRTPEEPHAGVMYYSRAENKLLPGSTGKGDRRLMAYTYLVVVKDYGSSTDHRLSPPPGYQESDYIHSPAWKESWAVTSGQMPHGKFELNQHPEGADLQGVNYNWPWQSPAQRSALEKVYKDHALGYLYYLQTHGGAPNIGLPDDEFPENGGFPETLYVREARRVVGLANLKEMDITLAGSRLRPDASGVGDYPMDSHAVRPKTDWTAPDSGEGEFWLYRETPWFQIPVGVVIPADRDGLLVAEAVSATHVAYGALRLEPVRMEMGELCGTLASISQTTGLRARAIPAPMIQDWLSADGQRIFWHADVNNDHPEGAAIQYLGAHGFWLDRTFKPDEIITCGEAVKALQALQAMEARQSGQEFLEVAVRRNRWPEPANPNAPLTRGVFADWLLRTQAILDPRDWSLSGPRDYGSRSVGDIPASGAIPVKDSSDAATLLHWRHIDVDTWTGTRWDSSGQPLFDPDLPVTRADFAEAIYLAQRYFPSPFFHQIGAIAPFYTEFPARTWK